MIRNHNHLLGQSKASTASRPAITRIGFNRVIRSAVVTATSSRCDGRASSRDGVMRGLLAEHMDEVRPTPRRDRRKAGRRRSTTALPASIRRNAAMRSPPANEDTTRGIRRRRCRPRGRSATARAVAAAQPVPARSPPRRRNVRRQPAASQRRAAAAIPGSTAPLQPVKVKTLVVRGSSL